MTKLNHRRPAALLAALILAVTAATPSLAQVWNEAGDAGDLPWSVQTPAGLYALN